MKKTIAYKAFNSDMKCRDFQYEVGKTYEHTRSIDLCSSGFHACTVPFDCWGYYNNSHTFALVSYEGVTQKDSNDSKIVGAKITIEATLSLPEWIKKQAETIISLCKSAKGTLSDSGHAAATGYRGHAAATGDSGHAAATGDRGHAAATGKWGAAVSLGVFGKAKSSDGGWITLAHYNSDYELVNVQTRKVGKRGLKPDTLYTRDTKTGKFIECKS